MSFQSTSKQDLVDAVNSKNSRTFKVTDFLFSDPKVVAGTWREQSTTRNTALRLTGAPGSGYQKSQVVTYDRLKLSDLTNIAGFAVKANRPATVHAMMDQLTYYTGIRFTTDDLEDLPITLDANGAGNAQLSAKPTSVGWIGSVMIPVTLGGIDFAGAVTTPTLLGLQYPNPEAVPGTDTMGSLYLYAYDFTAYDPDFMMQAPGVISSDFGDLLVTALKALDVSAGKNLWNNSAGSTAWSVQGATIVSNGQNQPTYPTNQNYKYVMALDLRSAVTIPKGRLYLHYNDPFDPNDF